MSKRLLLLFSASLLCMLTAIGCGSDGSSSSGGKQSGVHSTVANTYAIDAGDVCAYGGIMVQTGIDQNGNGLLDEDEVDAEQAVCNGADGSDGTDGSNGTDGLNSLINVVTEDPGTNCENGGQKILVGLDDNANGILDDAEVDSTAYLCNTTTFSEHAEGCSQGPFHCHGDFAEESGYVESKHVIHSDHINAGSDETCKACHDPYEEGYQFEDYTENAAVVSCSACHIDLTTGLLNKEPDFNNCSPLNAEGEQICHKTFEGVSAGHIEHHPFANNIIGLYKESAHGRMSEHTTGLCQICHTDEGFRAYSDTYTDDNHQTMGKAEWTAQWDLDAPVNAGESPVQCRTCHDAHSTELSVDATTEDVVVDNATETRTIFSAEFNLCTRCHQVFLDAAWDGTHKYEYTLAAAYSTSQSSIDNTTFYHETSHSDDGTRTIADTHFAGQRYNVNDGGVVTITGYNIDAASPFACSQCHDVHAASKFTYEHASAIAAGWGASAHGQYQDNAFTHFNEEEGECYACHSGRSFVSRTVGGSGESYSGTIGDPVACGACHDLQIANPEYDASVDYDEEKGNSYELGERREFEDNLTFPSGKTLTSEALGDNQICMSCHMGRNSGVTVQAYLDNSSNVAPYDLNAVSPHHGPAGANLYGNMSGIGYEFDGKSYASKFEHVTTNDSCTECHSPHSTALAVTTNHGGDADGDGVDAKPCVACHTDMVTDEDARDIRMTASAVDYDGDGDITEGMYYEIEGLKALLVTALNNAGATGTGAGRPGFSNLTTAVMLQAAYNYKVVAEDPGIYAHNSSYAIQLLYDSIEAVGGDVSGLKRDANGHFASADEAFRHWESGMSDSCARCHSSEGAQIFFATSDTVFEYTREDTMGISSGLACETCHVVDSDTVLTPASAEVVAAPAYTTFYADQATGAVFTMPAKGKSNLCISCHGGRNYGPYEQVTNNALTGSIRGNHYYPAAGTFFNTQGYEFEGKVYDATAGHTSLGGSTDGPCVTCHMTGATPEELHEFTIDFSTNTVCSTCHSYASPTSPAEYASIKAAYIAALELLDEEIVTKLNPDFSGHSVPAPNGSWGSKENMGAVFNYLYLEEEPGAFAHAPLYTKRLIFDSIDWLDNGAFDGTLDLTGHADVATWLNSNTTNVASVARP